MGIKERKVREKAQRRELILNSARKLLLEKGLEGATLNQIARRAELSPSALYNYYKNKEDIILALSEEGLVLLGALVAEEVRDSDPPPVRLEQLARAYWKFSRRYREYFDVITHFLTSPRTVLSADLKEMVDRQGDNILAVGLAVVREGLDSGVFKSVEPRKYILMFWGTLNGVIQMEKLQETILKNVAHQDLYEYTVRKLIGLASGGRL